MTESTAPVRPRIVDVSESSQDQEPKTYEEGIRLRLALIAEAQRIQDQLATQKGPEHDEWRPRARVALRHKQAELRRVKEWLRTHDSQRLTEWAILGRAHALLSAVVDHASDNWNMTEVFSGRMDEVESVLDAIERVVPAKHLQQAGPT